MGSALSRSRVLAIPLLSAPDVGESKGEMRVLGRNVGIRAVVSLFSHDLVIECLDVVSKDEGEQGSAVG